MADLEQPAPDGEDIIKSRWEMMLRGEPVVRHDGDGTRRFRKSRRKMAMRPRRTELIAAAMQEEQDRLSGPVWG